MDFVKASRSKIRILRDEIWRKTRKILAAGRMSSALFGYKETGQDALIAPTLELIPEIYFSKLELMASLLDGEVSYESAQKHKNICAEDLICMLIIAGKRLREQGEEDKARMQWRIALGVMDAFKQDFLEDKWFSSTVYDYTSEQRKEIEQLLGTQM